MTTGRWQQVKLLFHAALEHPSEERRAFLEQACANDEELRRDVEVLIASHEASPSFLETPAIAAVSLSAVEEESAPARLTAGTRLGPYEVVELLGRGGMGEVYRARDPRIGRDVAIKVLPLAFSEDRDRLRRFEQEARAAGQLNHPNILSIFDVGTERGAPYVVSELLEGATLRGRLARGALPIGVAVRYARQLVHGLAAAQAKGVVHRDLKPENIFITGDDRLKVLDFGLAKLAAASVTGEAVVPQTVTGQLMGTVGYMAPEQVRGREVDHRADIFAFGAILYEMLAGQRAFSGDSAADAISAILNEQPPALGTRVADLPPGLETTVARCLEKKPEDRFQTTDDLASTLESLSPSVITGGVLPTSPTARTERRWLKPALAIIGAALIAVVALTARSMLRSSATSVHETGRAEARRVVALLPFKNISADSAQVYFTSGVTEEIRGQLSKLSALRLLSRSAVERYGEADVRRMAQELGAGSVIEGSVRLDGQRVRVAVQLIDAGNEQSIWAEQFDRELHDIFAVQSDVALRIADALQATLTPDERRRVAKAPTENFAAYQLYLKSQQLPITERDRNLEAIEMLRKALALDPSFAIAQARLAYRTMFLGTFGDRRNVDHAIELAQKAIAIDPTIANGHVALASGFLEKGQYQNARMSFLRAMELDPNSGGSMSNLSVLEIDMGRYDESLAWARRAFRLAPNSPNAYYHVGVPLISLGADDISQRWLNEADRRFPNTTRILMQMALLKWLRGDQRDAMELARTLVERAPNDEEGLSLLAELTYLERTPDAERHAERSFRASPDLGRGFHTVPESARARYAYLLHLRGDTNRAKALMDESVKLAKDALQNGNPSSQVPLETAAIHSARRETALALDWLQRAYVAGWRDDRTLRRDPMFAHLRQDERFKALLDRMNADVADMRRRAKVQDVLQLLGASAAPSTGR